MARVPWRENKIVSIETRDDVFVLAQMLKAPYMMFFDLFSVGNDWRDTDLPSAPRLFCAAVSRGFVSHSNVERQTLAPANIDRLPTRWIDLKPDAELVTLWKGTPNERSLVVAGYGGGSLIEMDIMKDGFHEWPIILPHIRPPDAATIDSHELTNVRTESELNERLYQCFQFGRNVDPLKDLAFGRTIPIEYERYVSILCT